MIVMIEDRPTWCCDICHLPVWGAAAMLYTPSNGRGHYPAPVLCCGETCERAAARQLNAGPIRSVPWATFLQTLTERVAVGGR
jgi:hypothetical protein